MVVLILIKNALRQRINNLHFDSRVTEKVIMPMKKFNELVNALSFFGQFIRVLCSVKIEDGPDGTGEMFMRPGKLSDYFPKYGSILVFSKLLMA